LDAVRHIFFEVNVLGLHLHCHVSTAAGQCASSACADVVVDAPLQEQAAGSKRKKQQQQNGEGAHEQHEHQHHQLAEGEHHCCGEDNCGHSVQEHSLSSGADGEANPVAALPGLVLAPGVVRAVVAFMAAEGPEQVGQQRVGAAAALTSSAGVLLDVLCMQDAIPCITVPAILL
jgi:hypothetical protein